MSTIRAEVLEHIIDVVCEGESLGRDGMAYAREKLPAVPVAVIAEAWTLHDMRKTETWWQSIERTIDAPVIRRAIGQASS